MSWVSAAKPDCADRALTLELSPEPWERFRRLMHVTWEATEVDLLSLCRLRLAQVLGCRTALAGLSADDLAQLADWSHRDSYTERERAALDYAEQFQIDQNQITFQQRDALSRHMSEAGVANFVTALQVHDAYLRMMTFLDIEADAGSEIACQSSALEERGEDAGNGPRGGSYNSEMKSLVNPALQQASVEFARSTFRQDLVDAQTSEMCRLLNASRQNCSTCMSGRRDVERVDGIEDLMDLIVRFEASDLPERQKVALRLTDSFLTYPADVSEEDWFRIKEFFSPPQVIELLFKLLACPP